MANSGTTYPNAIECLDWALDCHCCLPGSVPDRVGLSRLALRATAQSAAATLTARLIRLPVPPRPSIAAESALAVCTYSAPSAISPRRETLPPTRLSPENQKHFQLTMLYCRMMHKLVF